ncbi:hypothetical protein I316_04226 [Kwoniella heveanensis BCC8398]|uniref:Major facilitator superfamily (MFS) profile domain-containing protein n=1 Tax=Kwoniella heveanensis BCC8398 TaxID=1296120 RepID=A0A1B9GTD5_9TREE|nr:hypothetical protein I316_04226 [Kwoniella heveanensis BCC8398]
MSSKLNQPTRPTLNAHASLTAHLRSDHNSRPSSPSVHGQQHEYVPTFDDIGITSTALDERALFDESNSGANTPLPTPAPHYGSTGLSTPYSEDQAEEAEEGGSAPEDIEREGSIARRPRWRRPSPGWVYPFIIGIPLCLGMAAAPKQELFINLACLAHPPSSTSQSQSTNGLHSNGRSEEIYDRSLSTWDAVLPVLTPPGIDSDSAIGVITPPLDNTTSLPPVLTPADRWFLRLQHDMYEYELHHHKSSSGHIGETTTLPPKANPTSPLPRPDRPLPGEGGADRSGQEDDDDEDPTVPEGGDRNPEKGRRPYKEIDPRLCKKDVKVQAAAAKLTMTMTTTMGVLAALTTGFWGQTSDRLGRTKVMAFVEIGLLMNELCFIAVATFPYLVPGGYRFLLLGPTIEGLAGGYSTITATVYAYVSDVTPGGSRVTIFARMSGIFMAGFALGPVLGSMLITWTGNIMTPFYINAIIYAIYIPLVIFILPESLSSEARLQLAKDAKLKKDEAARREAAEMEWENETPAVHGQGDETDPLLSGWSRTSFSGPGASKVQKKTLGRLRRTTKRLFGFLEPLAIFMPTDKENGKGKDWNLTCVGVAIFFSSMVFGIMQIKGQYTFFAFGWTAAQLGPFMSLSAVSRSFVLIAIVPAVMRYIKPRFLHAETGQPSSASPQPDLVTSTESNSGTSNAGKDDTSAATSAAPPQRSARLDLITARVAIMLEIVPYAFMAFALQPPQFILCSVLTTLGAPASPAINSLALSLLPDASQSGKLFGALSVLSAMGSSLLSPLLFGTLFATTVGTWPQAIFALTALYLVLAQTAMLFVRLDRGKTHSASNADVESAVANAGGHANGSGINQATTSRVKQGRGRDRRVKRVSTSSGSASGFANVSGYARSHLSQPESSI